MTQAVVKSNVSPYVELAMGGVVIGGVIGALFGGALKGAVIGAIGVPLFFMGMTVLALREMT